MEKKLKRQRIVIIILSLALIYSFVQFSNFKSETENRFNNLSYQYNNLNSTISSIYNNVDEKLEQQASLITYFNYEYGEADMENMKVPVSVKIIPKTATASTKLTLDFGARTVEMKKGENMEYTADFKSDLFLGESSGNVNLIIKEGKTSYTEELDWYISSLHSQYLPTLNAAFVFDKTAYTPGNGLKVDGDVMFIGDITEREESEFTNIKLVYKINRDIVEEYKIPETAFESAVDSISVYKTYADVRTGDTFELYAEAVDEHGFVHRVTVKKIIYVTDETFERETPIDGGEIILDKEGNILYGGKK